MNTRTLYTLPHHATLYCIVSYDNLLTTVDPYDDCLHAYIYPPTRIHTGVGTGTSAGTIASAGVASGDYIAGRGKDMMEEMKEGEASPSAPLPGASDSAGAMPTVHPSSAMPGGIAK